MKQQAQREGAEGLVRRLDEAESVIEISKALASTLDLDPLLELVLNTAMTHVAEAERGTIHLLDERGEYLEPRVSSLYGKNPRPAAQMKAGSGIAGQAIAERRTIYVPDTQADPRFVSTTGASAVRALISAPLVAEDVPLGVISISSSTPAAFDAHAPNLLSALAAQAAVAVKNARLYRALQARIQELYGLYEVSQAFSELTDLPGTYGRLTERMAQLVGARGCVIGVYDSETREVRARGPAYGVPDELLEKVRYQAGGEAKAFWNFREQGPLVANRPEQIAPSLRPLTASLGVKNLLVVPMLREGRVLGLIYAGNKPGEFTAEDGQLLSILAGQAAVVLENARLIEDLKRTRDELQRWSQELETRVEERTRELETAQAELLEAQRKGIIADLGARMAHELRHPLAVLANAIFLLRSHTPARSKRPHRYLELMEQAVDRSNRLINSLLAFAGRKRPVLGPVAMVEAVTETLDELELPRGVRLQTGELGVLPPVLADPQELRFVLAQIVANAVDAMPDGGRLSIHGEATEGRVRLLIEDSGTGIAPEDLERVFQPLFSTKPFGLGLGLSVARNLMEMMGGRLELSSRAGEGTRISLTLPVAPPPEAA